MKLLKKRRTTILLFSIIFCSCQSDKIKHNSTQHRIDLSGLSKYIKIKYPPSRVWWVHDKMGVANDRVPGPTDTYILAILEYKDSITYNKVASEIMQSGLTDMANKLLVDTSFFREWFPKEVKESFIQQSNLYELKSNQYNTNYFTNNDFFSGTCFFVGKDKFFVSLHSH